MHFLVNIHINNQFTLYKVNIVVEILLAPEIYKILFSFAENFACYAELLICMEIDVILVCTFIHTSM
jgi:hypothetical protein